MAPSNFLRGVAPRLVGVTAVLVFVCTLAVDALLTYRHHTLLLARESEHIKVMMRDLAPILTWPRLRLALSQSGESRRAGLGAARLTLQRHMPECVHFSIFSPGIGGRILYEFGEKLPALAPEALMQAGQEDGLAEPALAQGARVIIAHATFLPASATSTTPVAIVRFGIAVPSFAAFFIREARQDLRWIIFSFILSTLVISILFAFMTRSLRSVTSYASAIEHGQFNMELDIKSKDEARTIAEAFNVVLHQLKHSYVSTLGTLAALLETKDRTTETHSLRGVRYAVELGRGAGISQQELADLEYGALLHDIGKIGIADMILKKAGPLTEEEWAVMRQHPTIGYNVLRNLDFLQNALPVVLHHQERYDGRGYPNGLKGEQIPVLARIFTIADAFDAMTSERPYRKAMRPEVAIQEVQRNAGSQFDPRLAEIFARLWSEGKLANGDAAREPVAA